MAGIDCYMPANGETVSVTTNPSVPVDISLSLLKREMALGGMLAQKPGTQVSDGVGHSGLGTGGPHSFSSD